jgi:hypothetical protein
VVNSVRVKTNGSASGSMPHSDEVASLCFSLGTRALLGHSLQLAQKRIHAPSLSKALIEPGHHAARLWEALTTMRHWPCLRSRRTRSAPYPRAIGRCSEEANLATDTKHRTCKYRRLQTNRKTAGCAPNIRAPVPPSAHTTSTFTGTT